MNISKHLTIAESEKVSVKFSNSRNIKERRRKKAKRGHKILFKNLNKFLKREKL